jgi:hypothetical protein
LDGTWNFIEIAEGGNHPPSNRQSIRQINHTPMNDTLEVRPSPDRGTAAYVTRDVNAGELLGTLRGIRLPARTRYSIERDGDHYETGAPERYVNHACTPNAGWSGRELRALRSLQAGEEVTFDYTETESAFASPFLCRCGSENCRVKIGEPSA